MGGKTWHGASWETGYEHFLAFIQDTGSPTVPREYVCEDGFKLGSWIGTQRNSRRSGRLSAARFGLLDSTGLAWDPAADLQDEILREVQNYHREHGDLEVPSSHRTPGGRPLRSWLREQRKRRESGTISPDVEAELNRLDFVWEPDDPFSLGLAALAEYLREAGASHVPSNFVTTDGFALGRWYTKQRYLMGQDMPPDRVAALEALGVSREQSRKEESWEAGFAELQRWVEAHGHALVPTDYVTADGFKLGQWRRVQRTFAKQGRLREERAQRLDDLHPTWHEPPRKDLSAPSEWTERDALGVLRDAATMAFPLSVSAYNDLRAKRLVTGPGISWFIRRYATWTGACEAAGVEPGAHVGGGSKIYTSQDVLEYLRLFLSEREGPGDSVEYAAWAATADAPGIGTVKARFGSWRAARALAKEDPSIS